MQTGALILGGAHGSLEIARSLGRRGIPVWVVHWDNPLPTFSRYVTRSFIWHGPYGEAALAYLKSLASCHGLNNWVLFPGGDSEVKFIALNHAALANIFRLTTPPWEVARWAYDKRSMNARAAELAIAQPISHYPRSRADLAKLSIRYPVVLKPTVCEGRLAFASAKAWRADDPAQLAALYGQAEQLVGADCIMIQELIAGTGGAQFSYAGVWNHGAPVAAIVARRRRQYPIDFGFTSTFVETIELNDVSEQACRFLQSLDYTGLAEIEFKHDSRDGRYKILDVNARAWTWIGLGAAAGVDFAHIQWQLATGKDITAATPAVGASWRYLSRDLVACVQEWMAGKLSLTDCVRSLTARRGYRSVSAVFAWDDPLPAALDLPLVASRVIKRRISRGERPVAAPQSIKAPSCGLSRDATPTVRLEPPRP